MDKKKYGHNDKPAERSLPDGRMREEIAMELVNPRKYRAMMKLNSRKYASPKDYRNAVIETYRNTIQNKNTDE